jgi:hypothetical protein
MSWIDQDPQTYTEFMEDSRLLAEWGVIHRKTVTWHPTSSDTISVTSPKSPTANEAIVAAWEAAYDMGYSRPKWWEWWRWNEMKPFT